MDLKTFGFGAALHFHFELLLLLLPALMPRNQINKILR